MNKPKTTGSEIENKPAGWPKPDDREGYVWISVDDPDAASCEPSWHWGLFKLAADNSTDEAVS